MNGVFSGVSLFLLLWIVNRLPDNVLETKVSAVMIGLGLAYYFVRSLARLVAEELRRKGLTAH